jgi:hypothetical protein
MAGVSQVVYLVIKADRSVRVLRKLHLGLGPDEVAIPITLNFPVGWGRIQQAAALSVDLPEFVPEVQHGEQIAPAPLAAVPDQNED